MKIEGIMFETEKTDDQIVKKVRNNGRVVCVYGCGNIGLGVRDYMEKNGIPISFFVLDDEYCFFDEYQGIPVKKFSSIQHDKDSIDILIGFADFNKALQKLKEHGMEEHVYCISNPFVYLQEYDLNENFYLDNEDEFVEALSLFEDDLSKKIFVAYLNTRINKNYKYMLPFGGCKTYFNNELFTLSDEEIYVDCGAYNGDSIKNFLECVNKKYKKIYAMEPDKKNFNRIETYVSEEKLNDIVLVNKGVWKEKAKLGFSDAGEQDGSIVEKHTDNFIEVDSLDNIIGSEQATIIKFSVQGAEEDALLGAENIIKKFNPKLAVTIFMKPDALIRVSRMIKRINPEYKLYLRCEEAFFARVILYAKVED